MVKAIEVPIDLADLMGAAMQREQPAPLPSSEVQVMELRQLLEGYGKNPFKVGDLITPKKSAPLAGDGQPHIVLEVFSEPVVPPAEASDAGSPYFGAKYSMRVGGYSKSGAKMVMWLAEHEYYEPWMGDEGSSGRA